MEGTDERSDGFRLLDKRGRRTNENEKGGVKILMFYDDPTRRKGGINPDDDTTGQKGGQTGRDLGDIEGFEESGMEDVITEEEVEDIDKAS